MADCFAKGEYPRVGSSPTIVGSVACEIGYVPQSSGQIDTTIQEVYAALADDLARNELVVADLLRAVEDRRSPLLLAGRTNHLKYFETALSGKVSNVFVPKGGMRKKQRRTIAGAIAAVQESEPKVILATGSYIGKGFNEARLDTLFLAMPSWKGRSNSMLAVSIDSTMLSMSSVAHTQVERAHHERE
jgi:hypothetical protein